MPTFAGFKPEHFRFLRDLSRNNETAWFRRNRAAYDEIVENLRGLVDDLAPFLMGFDPSFELSGKIGGNLSRINRDIRFSKDKSPYKHNLYVYFYRRGGRPRHAGRLYVGLASECVTVGFSIYDSEDPGGSLRTVFLPRIRTQASYLQKYLAAKRVARRYDGIRYVVEKRDWREAEPFPVDSDEWLRTKGWVVRKLYARSHRGLDRASFISSIQSVFLDLAPIYFFASHPGKEWKSRFESLSRISARSTGAKPKRGA